MARSAKWEAAAKAASEHPEVFGGDLPSRIRHEHEQAGIAFQRAVEHAVRCGQLLAEAKAQTKHGEWGAWLDQHFPASRRTAQGYMRLAAHAEDAQRLAHLGVAGALKQLAAPREDEPRRLPETEGEVQTAMAGEAWLLLDNAQRQQVVERVARAKVAERGREPGHLTEAEVAIECALLFRKAAGHAALRMASKTADRFPALAAAAAELAACMMDEDSGPWEQREVEVEDRYLTALHAVKSELGDAWPEGLE